MASMYTYTHLLRFPSFIGLSVQVYIHYEYNPGQDREYCNDWIASSPGIAPEISLRSVQPLRMSEHPELEAWLSKNRDWQDFFNDIILHKVQAEIDDEDSTLYNDLLEYAEGHDV